MLINLLSNFSMIDKSSNCLFYFSSLRLDIIHYKSESQKLQELMSCTTNLILCIKKVDVMHYKIWCHGQEISWNQWRRSSHKTHIIHSQYVLMTIMFIWLLCFHGSYVHMTLMSSWLLWSCGSYVFVALMFMWLLCLHGS